MKKKTSFKRLLGKLPLFKVVTGDRAQRAAIVLFVYIAVLVLMMYSAMPERYSLQAGDIAPVDIPAQKDIIDTAETQKLINQAKASVKTIYSRDHTIPVEVRRKVEDFFDTVFEVRADQDLTPEQRAEKIKIRKTPGLEDKDIDTCLQAADDELGSIRQSILDVTEQIMSVGVTPDAIERSKKEIADFFNKQHYRQPMKDLGYNISVGVIRPNLLPDEEETKRDLEEAARSVTPVIIRKGQNIVNKGEVLTRAHIDMLKNAGLLKESFVDLRLLTGYGVLILILTVLTVLYIKYFHRPIYVNRGNLMMIGLITVVILFVSFGSSMLSKYLAPVPAISMLITMLLSPRLAIMITLPIAISMGLLAGNDITVVFTALIGGLVGSMKIMESNQRRDLFFAGLLVGVSNSLVILAMATVTGSGILGALRESAWGLLNGGFVAVLTIGTLPIWENLFDIITPLKLLELSNPNQPLLKKLLMEAPGTYHHSIIVGNLAEYAAREIGANSLLARVGAYYHDVGKVKRPYFFSENQMAGDNPHDKITPSLSTLIITSHVSDGVEMAKQSKIPGIIRDIIEQHHGDSIVAYFYHKATAATTLNATALWPLGIPPLRGVPSPVIDLATKTTSATSSKLMKVMCTGDCRTFQSSVYVNG
jgi:putative nucleotidyltransferase with HDIG domain